MEQIHIKTARTSFFPISILTFFQGVFLIWCLFNWLQLPDPKRAFLFVMGLVFLTGLWLTITLLSVELRIADSFMEVKLPFFYKKKIIDMHSIEGLQWQRGGFIIFYNGNRLYIPLMLFRVSEFIEVALFFRNKISFDCQSYWERFANRWLPSSQK